MTKQYITYTYTDPSRNEVIYVGKGTLQRSRDHLKACLTTNSLFYNRLRKMLQNGIQPIIEVIECENEDEAFIREIHTINRIGRKDLGLGTLLNQTDGGQGGTGAVYVRAPMSAETKRKISATSTGRKFTTEHRNNISKALKGKPQTEAAKKSLGKATRGRTLTPEWRKKVSDGLKGRTLSAEHKMNLSISAKNRRNEWNKGLKKNDKRNSC